MVEQEKAALLQKIADSEALPSLSPLAIQLIELAADEGTSAADLARVIEKDPGLTTRLLKLVGSAFFSRPEMVTSVSQAVVLAGFKKVRIMALSLSLRDTFPMDRTEGMDYGLFWKTCLYRALIAQDFAQSVPPAKNVHPEEAFLAGLISEIGLLLLFHECPETKKKDFPGGGAPLEIAIRWEEEQFGVNHRELGCVVFQRWGFPEYLVESQKRFGARALEPDSPVLCKTVELARRATDVVFDETTGLHAFHELVRRSINLRPEAVNEVLAKAFRKVEELATQLLVEVDSQTDILAVMEKANQALARINRSMENTLQGLLDSVGPADRLQGGLQTAESRQDILQNTLDAVAHEIRNPLLAIGGFSKRLAREAEGKGRGSQYAKIITEESARLENVLNEVTEYCQEYRPDVRQEDLVQIVVAVLGEMEGLFGERQVQVVRDFKQAPVAVTVEREGIAKAFRQLVHDAVSRIDHTKGVIRVSMGAGETNQVSVTIADNGRSIPEGIRDVLINGNLSAKAFAGNLGLALARKIIEAHQGRISLFEEGGRRNRVTVTLPAVSKTARVKT